MHARMKHPAFVLPGAMQALTGLSKSVDQSGLPRSTRDLVALRASQINGCSVCTGMHAADMRKAGERDERLFAVAAWRDAPYFTDAERAALALAEAATRLADTADPVPDEIWAEAAAHHSESELAGLLLTISAINVWNRLNVATRQVAGPSELHRNLI
jgi:AhpD family alkylhydroperoxidase